MQYNKIVISKNGAPEVLEVKTQNLTPNQKNGLLIEVWAAGVGFADIMAQHGGYALAPKKPFTPGYDFVGKIIDPYDAAQFKKGDLVAALLPRMCTYSEIIEVPEKYLVKLPANTPIIETAAAVLNYLTAYCIMEQKAKVQDGQTVFIQGASGGVGMALAQIGRLKNLKMFGTTSAAKAKSLMEIGVEPIDYKKEYTIEAIRSRLPEGVDAAFDARGGQSLADCIKIVKRGGVVVTYGFSGDGFGGNAAMFKGLGMIIRNLLTPNGKQIKICATPSEVDKNNSWYKNTLAKIIQQINTKELQPIIGEAVSLNEAARAHALMESGKSLGKIVLKTKYCQD